MKIDLKDGLVQLKITSAVCSFVAICVTIFRLWKRKGRFWVDDMAAAIALGALCIQVVSVFLHLPVPNSQSKTTRVAAYYLMAYTFYAVIFFSRLSILFSIIRIDPSPRRRRFLYYSAVFVICALLFLMAQLLWVCEPEPGWKDAANPQCHLPRQVAICQLVTDVIIDGILIVAPLTLLKTLQDRTLRRKLAIIFSTCVVTTIVSLVHAAYIISNGGIKVVISAIVEDSCSLIVANIPVVVTAALRLTREDDQVRTYGNSDLRFNSRLKKASSSTGFSTTRGQPGSLTANVALETISETSTKGTDKEDGRGRSFARVGLDSHETPLGDQKQTSFV
ncbi:hypothetical protein DL96DRAFT_1572760 [Flagelloscypha sp. PMI_526]|nr:hypothetical protein DL96DRAFT_1572760 [Flagelloscypha sp. PMI_526]